MFTEPLLITIYPSNLLHPSDIFRTSYLSMQCVMVVVIYDYLKAFLDVEYPDLIIMTLVKHVLHKQLF